MDLTSLNVSIYTYTEYPADDHKLRADFGSWGQCNAPKLTSRPVHMWDDFTAVANAQITDKISRGHVSYESPHTFVISDADLGFDTRDCNRRIVEMSALIWRNHLSMTVRLLSEADEVRSDIFTCIETPTMDIPIVGGEQLAIAHTQCSLHQNKLHSVNLEFLKGYADLLSILLLQEWTSPQLAATDFGRGINYAYLERVLAPGVLIMLASMRPMQASHL